MYFDEKWDDKFLSVRSNYKRISWLMMMRMRSIGLLAGGVMMLSVGMAQAKKTSDKEDKVPEAFKVNCAACHISDRVQVGPHFVHIQEYYPKSKQKQFIEWCKNPGKRNPEMPQMPSMAHVSEEDLIKIHAYMLSVDVKNPKGASNKDNFPDTRRPRIVRTFLPDCGPASLFVTLPTSSQLNFIWDTDQCRLRYLTTGEPDNFPYWKSNGNSLANPGKQVYVEDGLFTSDSKRKFLGYKVKKGLPVFFYEVDGKRVEEAYSLQGETLVRTLTGKSGLPAYELESKNLGEKMQTELKKSKDSIVITHTLSL